MDWLNKGLIFNNNNIAGWALNGAMIPTPYLLNDMVVRVFCTFLDKYGIGRTGYVDLDTSNLTKIINVSLEPLFDIGMPGTFDENGCLTCSLTKTPSGDFYFYYAGFELGTKIRYRLLTGLAILNSKFRIKKKIITPVLERSSNELFFRGGPFCLYENGIYRMWYVGGSEWTTIDNKKMPVYEIKYIESENGINWPAEGKTCIRISNQNEHGFGRPYIYKDNNIYKMFYSIRVKSLGYRLGYAESDDGLNWIRFDDKMDVLNNLDETGWCSNMICYSSVIKINKKLIMFFNGNDFGKTGFGYAEMVNN